MVYDRKTEKDPIVKLMRKTGIPVNRENWLKVNYLGDEPPAFFEGEDDEPPPFRRRRKPVRKQTARRAK